MKNHVGLFHTPKYKPCSANFDEAVDSLFTFHTKEVARQSDERKGRGRKYLISENIVFKFQAQKHM